MTVDWATGTDESHWQTPSLSFAHARKQAGDTFAIIKASDGTSTDATSTAHYRYFGQVGIARGAYHFYRSQVDVKQQADKLLARMAAIGPWELPPTCDYENAATPEHPDELLRFLELVEQGCGRTPILYTGPAWWRKTIGGDQRFERFPLWLAEYLTKYKDGSRLPEGFEVPAPSPWPVWSIWQFSDSSGHLDRDVMTRAELADLTGNHPTPTPEDDMTPAQEADLAAVAAFAKKYAPILDRLEHDYLTKGESVRQVIVENAATCDDLASGKRPVKKP